MNIPVSFLGAKAKTVMGIKQGFDEQRAIQRDVARGKFPVLVTMVQSCQVGLNLQRMNWMVSMYPISVHADQEQAMGNIVLTFNLIVRPLLSHWTIEAN